MEFHIPLAGSLPDLGAVEETLRSVDPAALVDIDPAGRTLRVTAVLSVSELAALLGVAGLPAAPHQVIQQPSVCCGGCSG